MRNVLDFSYGTSDYRQTDYTTGLIGTSDCNMFVPFYAVFAHQLLSLQEGQVQVMEYQVPSDVSVGRSRTDRQYAVLLNNLRNARRPKKYAYMLAGLEHTFDYHKGFIAKEGRVLMCLGINSEYIMETPFTEIQDNPDISKFTLFISNAFEEDETLKNIRKRVNTEYIADCKAVGIDIMYTSRIEEWLYSNNYTAPNFANVVEMMQHLKEVPASLLI